MGYRAVGADEFHGIFSGSKQGASNADDLIGQAKGFRGVMEAAMSRNYGPSAVWQYNAHQAHTAGGAGLANANANYDLATAEGGKTLVLGHEDSARNQQSNSSVQDSAVSALQLNLEA
jgi:hypothetical protein